MEEKVLQGKKIGMLVLLGWLAVTAAAIAGVVFGGIHHTRTGPYRGDYFHEDPHSYCHAHMHRCANRNSAYETQPGIAGCLRRPAGWDMPDFSVSFSSVCGIICRRSNGLQPAAGHAL